MKFDARTLSSEIDGYDLCIVGSGPAGFTVALELMHSGLRICLIDAGDLDGADREADDLKIVESKGIEIRPDSRQRILGGTSETWSGYMAPLDPVDLEPRQGMHEGWPISGEDIASNLDRHGHRYDIPHSNQFEPGDETIPLTTFDGLESKTFRVQVRPLRFRKAFEHVFLSSSIDLLYGATVTRLVSGNGDGSPAIRQAIFIDRDGNEHRLSAKIFVLAASAIESVRIALNSSLADPHDQIGRNFMNHPKGNVAKVYFSSPLSSDHPLFQTKEAKYGRYIGLRLPDERQVSDDLLNAYLRFEPSHDTKEYPRAARLSASFKSLKRGVKQAGIGERLRLIGGLIAEAGGLPELVTRSRARAKTKRSKSVASAVVRCFTEMEPIAENRVTLSQARDRLGMPIPVVSHANSARSIATVDALLSTLEQNLSGKGLGRLERLNEDLGALLDNDASHHLGGLRMGKNPATSVVDDTLRFHHLSNLYAAGGSVFPTGGSANPTLTIVGLSIGLAETLRQSISADDKPLMDQPRSGAGFLIVGAGRRVREDVIPAIEKLETAHISDIYATSEKALFGIDRTYEVAALAALSAESLRKAKYVYVAVPPAKLKTVLQRLTDFDCSRTVLVIDTPAIQSSELSPLYSRFAAVAVAEDCAYLPWIPLLNSTSAPIDRIDFLQSGFAYHAVALAKAVVANGAERPKVRRFNRAKNRLSVEFSNRSSMRIIGARDYKRGKLRFYATDGSIVGSHADPDSGAVIQPMLQEGRCVGFQHGQKTVSLTNEETQLAGSFSPDDTIVSRMLDIKRVGLMRLLSDLTAGEQTYPLSEGAEDAKAAPG